MPDDTIFQQAMAYVNRPNPYPLYARLRETPVSLQQGAGFVVSSHAAISTLLADPRLSSENERREQAAGASPYGENPLGPPGFLFLDPPQHDRLRALTMKHFGPPCYPGRVEGMRPGIARIVDGLLDAQRGKSQFDVVDDLAYPLPVTVICELLGVPQEDEPKFRVWSDALVASLTPDASTIPPEEQQKIGEAIVQIRQYMSALIAAHREHPGDDLLSAMVTDHDPGAPMDEQDLISTAVLLLVAGHETTVNLITNGMLTLLRHPDALDRLRRDPAIITPLVEELLRYEPPVQLTVRTALADIAIDGAVIPSGAPVVLLLAAGSRDPRYFAHPDQFDPERQDNEHFGFGGGVHYCFGGPLARVETQVALVEMARRLENPRLVTDAPPYRPSPVLRGPRHLEVAFDRVVD